MMPRARHEHKQLRGGAAAAGAPRRKRARGDAPAARPLEGPAWLPAEIVPAPRPRTVLVSYGRADAPIADGVVTLLQRAGHLVWIDRSARGDGWGGRLLDTMWSCDAVIFLVSPAAADSPRVAREVHVAGSEHTPVVPVLLADAELPDDLAYYLDLRPSVDLRADRTGGLRTLVDEVNGLPRKHIARPRRLAALTVVVLALLIGVWLGLRVLLG